jgi:hypothetical protein
VGKKRAQKAVLSGYASSCLLLLHPDVKHTNGRQELCTCPLQTTIRIVAQQCDPSLPGTMYIHGWGKICFNATMVRGGRGGKESTRRSRTSRKEQPHERVFSRVARARLVSRVGPINRSQSECPEGSMQQNCGSTRVASVFLSHLQAVGLGTIVSAIHCFA